MLGHGFWPRSRDRQLAYVARHEPIRPARASCCHSDPGAGDLRRTRRPLQPAAESGNERCNCRVRLRGDLRSRPSLEPRQSRSVQPAACGLSGGTFADQVRRHDAIHQQRSRGVVFVAGQLPLAADCNAAEQAAAIPTAMLTGPAYTTAATGKLSLVDHERTRFRLPDASLLGCQVRIYPTNSSLCCLR